MTDTKTTTPPRPTALPVTPDAIPALLRETARWVLWRYQLVDRGSGANARKVWAKVPKMANGRNARSTDPASWTTYDRALKAYKARSNWADAFDGIGFIFDGSDDLLGIDLDDCVETDVLGDLVPNAFALDTMARLSGYWEFSPSGTGVKGWVRAPGIGAQKDDDLGIEVYDAGRYFTVTGREVSPCPWEAAFPEVRDAVHAWMTEHLSVVAPKQQVAVHSVTGDDALDAFIELSNEPTRPAGWTLERVRAEIAPYLDVEAHYEDWVKVGMILHHQFEGSADALELWQDIYRGGSKFDEDTGEEKWASFGKRTRKGTIATLGTLLHNTKAKREADPVYKTKAATAAAVAAASTMDGHRAAIESAADAKALEKLARETLAKDKTLNTLEREVLARALQSRAAVLTGGTKPPIGDMRRWLSGGGGGSGGGTMPPVMKDWVFLTGEDRYYNLATYQPPITARSFDVMFDRFVPPGSTYESADLMFRRVWSGPHLARRLYAPPHGVLFTWDGIEYANAYNPDSVPEAARDPAAEAVLDDHMARLIPDARDRRLLMTWMARNVQRTGELIQWAPYVCSRVQGTGKSALGRILAAAMGQANVGSVPIKGLHDKFTSWAYGKAVNVLDEVKLHGESRHDVVNALKVYLTERMVSVERKGADAFDAPNFTNYMLLSNYEDGLPIDEADRRYAFFVSPMTEAQVRANLEAGHYERLFNVVANQPGAVRAWLLNYPLDPEAMQPRAPDTTGRARVLEAVEPETVTAARQMIAAGCRGVTGKALIVSALARGIREKLGYRPNTSTMSSALERLGFERFSRAFKWDGSMEAVWVRGTAGFKPGDNNAVREELESSADSTEFDGL